MSDKDAIYRQDAIDAVCTVVIGMSDYPLTYAYEIAEEALEDVPPAEPERKKGKWIKIEPQKKGKWMEIKYAFRHKCSNCEWINNADSGYNFCPNCGCQMNGGEEDERF